ncbi:hypothetical protein AB0M46_29620 [Dactylosporangium sp. NPDC051485]|uniref:hypothetical protein n=1 Tax=Dactylosporangium sp. NPDC051485 TaxID=3154846 RepID=UPI00343ABA91
MTYPGSPQGNPNEGYGYPDPNAPTGAYPPPQAPAGGYPGSPAAPQYGEPAPQYGQPAPQYGQPAPQYGQPVPPQPQPVHDQGTTQLPTYGEATYSLDPSVSAPPTAPVPLAQPAPPMSAPPMSGPPMSGPPMSYGPVSGPPTSGFPGAYPAPPAKKRGIAVPLLASLLTLAVIAAGVFVFLYVDKSDKLTQSETQSAQRQAALDQSNKDLDQTKTDLKAKADELTKAQQDLRGTQADSTEAKRQRDVIGSCLKLLIEALDASNQGDKTTAQNKISQMEKPCNEAQRILGI